LGRPPKNPEISAAQKQQLRADQKRRNEVEGCFGSGKRKYSLDLIMARLSKGAENSISMAFVVMCVEKIRRILRLFFITIFVWIYAFQRPGSLWMVLRKILRIEIEELLVTA
jgi:transposase, IS5 family